MKPSTRLQHEGEDREAHGGAVSPPIHRTSLFTFPDCATFEACHGGQGGRHLYSRVSNPTVSVLEHKLADLEGYDTALACASGMAAVSAVLLGLLRAGDHVVMVSCAYGPTLAFARGPLARFGVDVSFVPAGELGDPGSHLRESTRLIYLESPGSLTFDILDLPAISDVARDRGIPTVLDNSWATPLYQRPADLGLDLSLHSGTKYLSGHSDILLGAVTGRAELMSRVRRMATLLGGSLSPEDAFLAIRGLRTLPLRMAQHQQNGLRVASFLESQPRVSSVLHPGLPSFAGHALARRQFAGWSGLFSFVLDGDPRRFVDALEIFSIGVSWGGFESLALPAGLLASRPPERDLRPDIPPGLVRLSIGLEDADDLIADLERGFRAI